MRKNIDPTSDEIEFLFNCFQRGLSNTEISVERDETEFPLRDARFLNKTRRHWEAAKKILESGIKQKLEPTAIEAKTAHFAKLTEIAKNLLARDLDMLVKGQFEGSDGNKLAYGIKDSSGAEPLTKRELIVKLESNFYEVWSGLGDFLFSTCFLEHLKAESSEVSSKGIETMIHEQPYELINLLRILVERGIFKGTCPICKEW